MTNREIILHCLNEESEITCRFSPCDKPEQEGNTGECCKKCSLNILEEYDNEIYNKAIDDLTEKYFDAIENVLHDKDIKLELNQALTIYARIMNSCNEIAEQLKRGGKDE